MGASGGVAADLSNPKRVVASSESGPRYSRKGRKRPSFSCKYLRVASGRPGGGRPQPAEHDEGAPGERDRRQRVGRIGTRNPEQGAADQGADRVSGRVEQIENPVPKPALDFAESLVEPRDCGGECEAESGPEHSERQCRSHGP